MATDRAVGGQVRGRVQGVGFRWFVLHSARKLGLTGYVRNRSDGWVEFRAQGTSEDLDRLLQAIGHGPSGARVDSLDSWDVEWTEDERTFEVRS